MSGDSVPDGFWPALAASLLHPVQLQIIEAIAWIDRPVSASELVKLFGGEQRLSAVAYHVRRLADIGALQPIEQRQPTRGSLEWLYQLGLAGKSGESLR
jgi:Helix-turn-helix domain